MSSLPSRRNALPLSRPDLWACGVLVAFTLIVRAAWFGDPNADLDEQLYSLIGNAMLDGQVAFVDLWDRKPFGLFALFALAHALFGPGPEAYQLLAAGFCAAGAVLTYVIARDLTDRGTATAAGLIYIVLSVIYGANSGNSEAFFVPMMLAMAVLLRDPSHPQATGRILAAMLIGGLALQIKYTVLPQCVFFGLWALWGQYRHRRNPMGIVALGAVCALLGLLPTALVALGYALAGYWDEFVFANFISFFDRLPAAGGRMRPDIAAFMVPFAALGLAGMRAVWQARPAPVSRTYVFVLLWLAASLVTVFLPGTVYRYYLVALVPASVLTSLPFFQPKEPTRFNIPALLPVVLYLAVMPFQFMATQENRIATEAFARAIAPRIDAAAGRCLFIFDGPTALYRITESCIPSRFVYPDHLNNALERYALGVSQEGEVARILATRPPVIITADKAFTPQNPEAMRRVKQALARDYSEIASTTLHNRLVRAWALRD